MTEAEAQGWTLGARLKDLRSSSGLGYLRQRQVAETLQVSSSLLSTWESGSAVPTEDRLRSFSRLFCTLRSRSGEKLVLIGAADLSVEERAERDRLFGELQQLRDAASGRSSAAATGDEAVPEEGRGSLGGRFFFFPNGQPVTILYTPLSARQLGVPVMGDDGEPAADETGHYLRRPLISADPLVTQYTANPTHPNFIRQFGNGDIDALLELVGHIRAENPGLEVRWMPNAEVRSADDLSANVIILGGADETAPESVSFFIEAVDIPVRGRSIPGGLDEEYDHEFYVEGSDESFQPVFVFEDDEPVMERGARLLESDLARIARRPNPQNASASVTFLAGLFSRGTFGAVRTFTDSLLRARNEGLVYNRLDPTDFWLLTRVPLFANRTTLTPDLAGPLHLLRTSNAGVPLLTSGR